MGVAIFWREEGDTASADIQSAPAGGAGEADFDVGAVGIYDVRDQQSGANLLQCVPEVLRR